MTFRVPAPGLTRGKNEPPLLVLPEETVLHGYRLRFLGAGGMSTVYRGSRGGQDCLVKEVAACESDHVIALNREKFTLDRLDHPGVIKASDLFEEDGYYYLVLDFVEGENLEALATPFPDTFLQESVVLDWALQLCDIFEYLHSQTPPVVHRDLKPGNVMRDSQGRLHLVDFGISRSYRSEKNRDTQPMGSVLTASPEHYGCAQTDARSDIYTLGATLHWLLSNGQGRSPDNPFRFTPLRTVNPGVSASLEQLLQKATAFEPLDRFQNVGELRLALLACRTGALPGPGEAVSPICPPGGTRTNGKLVPALGSRTILWITAPMVLLLALLGWDLAGNLPETPLPEPGSDYRVSIPPGYRLDRRLPPAPEAGFGPIEEYRATSADNPRTLRIATRAWPKPVTLEQAAAEQGQSLATLGVRDINFGPHSGGPGVDLHGRRRTPNGDDMVSHEWVLPGRQPNAMYILSAECRLRHDAVNAPEFARFFASFSPEAP